VRVNTDYGRDGDDIKSNDKGEHTIPDIIVHVPGRKGPNIAVMEVKTWWNSGIQKDTKKLFGYLSSQNYAFAYLVILKKTTAEVRQITA
jgi:hypothetical protein